MPVNAEFQAYLHVSTYNPNPPSAASVPPPALTLLQLVYGLSLLESALGTSKGLRLAWGFQLIVQELSEKALFKTWPPENSLLQLQA